MMRFLPQGRKGIYAENRNEIMTNVIFASLCVHLAFFAFKLLNIKNP
jgi:hypothetical protein